MSGKIPYNADLEVQGKVTVYSLIKENIDDTYLLLGGGGHIEISYFAPQVPGGYWHQGNLNPNDFALITSLNDYYKKSESNSRYVSLLGDQTISDVKKFTSSPEIPEATALNNPVPLGQMETLISSAITESNENDRFKTTINESGEVEHGLNTYDVTADFYDIATMYTVGARIQRITTNKVFVHFDTQPPNPVKVLIKKF